MNYFITKEQYLQVKASWKQYIATNSASASDIVVYNILRSFPKDRGFTAITNPVKLANGRVANEAYNSAIGSLKSDIKWTKDFQKQLSLKFGMLFEDPEFWERFKVELAK